MPNPQNTRKSDSRPIERQFVGIETGTITLTKEHTSGDDIGHHVEVKPDSVGASVIVDVVVSQQGDTAIPTEGDRVVIAHRKTGRPIVLGSLYDTETEIPEFVPGERRIGHPTSDGYVEFRDDGTIVVADESGHGIELQNNGEVHIYGEVKQHTSQTLDV